MGIGECLVREAEEFHDGLQIARYRSTARNDGQICGSVELEPICNFPSDSTIICFQNRTPLLYTVVM